MEEKLTEIEEKEEKIKLKPSFWFNLIVITAFIVLWILKSVMLKQITFADMQTDLAMFAITLRTVGVIDAFRALCLAALIIFWLIQFMRLSIKKADAAYQERVQIGLVAFGLLFALIGPIVMAVRCNQQFFEYGYIGTLVFNASSEITENLNSTSDDEMIILSEAVPFEWDKVYVVSSYLSSNNLGEYAEGEVYNQLVDRVGQMAQYYSESNAVNNFYFFYNDRLIFEYSYISLKIYDSSTDFSEGPVYFREFSKDAAVFYRYEDEPRVWLIQNDN